VEFVHQDPDLIQQLKLMRIRIRNLGSFHPGCITADLDCETLLICYLIALNLVSRRAILWQLMRPTSHSSTQWTSGSPASRCPGSCLLHNYMTRTGRRFHIAFSK